MHKHISSIIAGAAAGLCLGTASMAAQAQTEYPTKAVRMVVGFTPGSATDVVARIFAQRFTEAWGASVVVENIPGVAGAVGVSRVAKSPPDGYTLMFSGNAALTILPSLQSKPLYDVLRDLAPISMVLTMPSILAVNNEVPVKSVQEFIAHAKANPKKLSYASPGAGTPQHIAGELLKGLAGIDVTHVPYKGAVMTDVIGGRVTATIQNAGAILPVIRDGRLRGLAVTSLQRSSNIPEFPTMAESGFPGFEAVSWFGLLGPAGTPAQVRTKVYQESMRVVENAEMRARFSQLGLDITPKRGEEVTAIIKADIAKWAKVIKDAGIALSD
ncbi:MAG: tripartite tricarboxylate transporter substrate binding protein [Betaproteobacteria bacterium]|nr:tripartite tricarboxylate transporter substrate binding protein [Betaproteobacteria bacterium]